MDNQFDFKPNDIIDYCGDKFLVVNNWGSKGEVREYVNNEKASDYIIDFYWDFGGIQCKLVGHLE